MRLLEEGKRIFEEKSLAISEGKCKVYSAVNLPREKCEKAIKAYAPGAKEDSVIGLIDNSITKNGSAGALFTDYKFYFTDFPHKPKKIWYDEIQVAYVKKKTKKAQDSEQSIEIYLKDGTKYSWSCNEVNMQPIVEFIGNMMKLSDNPGLDYEELHVEIPNDFRPGADAAGIAIGTRGTVNKVYEEEKFHAYQGHGFAAERANDLADRMRGHDAKVVGDDNAKNGADRIVDGIFIQSKYCATGARCIDSCFEDYGNGTFRYIGKNGEPMVIEVPNDESIYTSAVDRMRIKIINGQVPGTTNPNDAEKIVKRGTVTYKQAVNIAKAGTIDSLIYDAQKSVVFSASAFGVSAVVTFASSLWNDEKLDVALKKATYSGLKVGGTAFITSILASQLAKAGLNSMLVTSSEAVVRIIGPKAAAVLINAFRNGTNIYGAAAMKSAAKLLRGNTITGAVTVVVLSLGDVINIFRGRISKSQLVKDAVNATATVLGGTGGVYIGSALGSIVLPGAGTVVGGVIGGFGGGALLGKGANYLTDKFVEDDAEKMVSIIETVFQSLAADYMLNSVEAEKIVDKLSQSLNGKKLKEMFASSDRVLFAENMLCPLIEDQVQKRHHISLPSDEAMRNTLREVLESIADEQGLQPA